MGSRPHGLAERVVSVLEGLALGFTGRLPLLTGGWVLRRTVRSESEPRGGSVSKEEEHMSVDRPTRSVLMLGLVGFTLVAVAAAGRPSVAAGASGQPTGSIAADQGNPGAVPPILEPARASDLATIKQAEAESDAAHSYTVPAGARYSSAETDAYATDARPVAAPGPASGGFDYGDAAIGAGFAVAIIALIAAGGLAVRRRRHPEYS
jgi:hypothetical protein